jgi:IS1 family transposase
MRFVQVNRLELDELWSYVGKEQRKVKQTDPADLGDQYVLIGIDATRKAIISYRVGKRDGENTNAFFLADLRERIVNRPEISSDGFPAYPDAVERAFGLDCSFAQIIKQYRGEPAVDTARRYSPGVVIGVERRWVIGAQRKVCTSYVERGNLSVRAASRRFTRLTNSFSKKLANHVAAVSLYVAHFNLCRVHEALRITPAMAMGITDHIWTIGELIDAATAEPMEQQAA